MKNIVMPSVSMMLFWCEWLSWIQTDFRHNKLIHVSLEGIGSRQDLDKNCRKSEHGQQLCVEKIEFVHFFIVFGLVLKMARFLSCSKDTHTILRRENMHLSVSLNNTYYWKLNFSFPFVWRQGVTPWTRRVLNSLKSFCLAIKDL